MINDLGVEGRGLLLGLLDGLRGLRLSRGSNFLRGRDGCSGLLSSLFGGSGRFIVTLLIDISQDIVQNEVARGLLGENEGLDKLLRLGSLVRSLANNLDDDVVERSLGVNIGNSDLAVLEVEGFDTFLDVLLFY